MWRAVMAIVLGVALAGVVLAHAVFAQNPAASGPGQSHQQGSMPLRGADVQAQPMQTMRAMAGVAPTMPGQDIFGAIAEIVGILEADPATNWTKVDVERLRQHLIDMNEVTLRADAAPKQVDGGLEIAVTGTGRTLVAIQRMVPAWAQTMNGHQGWSTKAASLPNGESFSLSSQPIRRKSSLFAASVLLVYW